MASIPGNVPIVKSCYDLFQIKSNSELALPGPKHQLLSAVHLPQSPRFIHTYSCLAPPGPKSMSSMMPQSLLFTRYAITCSGKGQGKASVVLCTTCIAHQLWRQECRVSYSPRAVHTCSCPAPPVRQVTSIREGLIICGSLRNVRWCRSSPANHFSFLASPGSWPRSVRTRVVKSKSLLRRKSLKSNKSVISLKVYYHLVTDFWLKIFAVRECLLQTKNSEQSKVHLKRNKSNISTHNVSHPNPIQSGHC